MAAKTGLTVLLERGLHIRQSIGLITNHTGLGPDLSRNLDLMLQRGYRVRALFAPEHGIYGDHKEGEPVQGERDPATGIPVYSLYGAETAPSADVLAGLDVLIFDIQDIGARHYTYPATMIRSMEAAAECGVTFTVLDRPNPIGGLDVEGNVAAPDKVSFVCPAPVAIRHGLTVGEMALLAAAWKGLPAPEVVRMEGWSRDMYFQETGLPWVPPSPNAPTLDMAVVYPGTCLLEGTNVSEGRGTSLPFEVAGAPWVDGDALAARLRERRMPGVLWRPARFRPSSGKWAGESCGGVQVHVRDPRAIRPVELGVRLLFALRDTQGERFALREPPSGGSFHVDRLAGGSELREALSGEDSPERLLAAWRDQSQDFQAKRRQFLLYD